MALNNAHANCTIYFHKNTIYTGNKKNLKSSQIIRKTDCNKDIREKFHQIVINSSGTLKSKYLKGIDPSIEYFPKHFHLTPLKKILRDKMGLAPDKEFTKLRFMDGASAINLKKDQLLEIPSGFKTGNMAFTLEVIGKDGNSSTIWVKAKGVKYMEVYTAKYDISPSEDLSIGQFKKIRKKITNPESYFLDNETISYHHLNRSLREGEILKKSYLIKKNLVTFGAPTKVSFKRGNLILKGIGIPLGQGRYGDFVKLKNPKNKKIIYGKVNGHNSVLVGI
jgi:flagella basal body P-ring formation protein FlgA